MLFLVMGAAFLCAQDARAESERIPSEVVARVNGQDLEVRAFADWLLKHHGWSHLDRFVELTALRQEAQRLDIVIGEAELDEALAQDWQDNVLLRFGGKEEQFLAELERTGMGKAGWFTRRRAALENELLAQRLSIAAREPTEKQLRKTFEDEFGADATRKHLRVAFFDRFRGVTPEAARNANLTALDQVALQRARSFLEAARAEPGNFAVLVEHQSDLNVLPRWDSYNTDLRHRGGELRRYRSEYFNGVIDAALRTAEKTPGEYLEPIMTPRGAYVVFIVAWESVEFDDVVDEIREYFLTRPATAQEIYFYKKALMERAEVTKNPSFDID